MVGNFRLANVFAAVMSRLVYNDVFFDRFNSVFKGFYLLVGQQQLAEMIQRNDYITFVKIPSTERFGHQDVTQLELRDTSLITPNQQKMIVILNSVIATGSYRCVDEY
ncbi:MAG: hypothetical protein LBH28_08105 [Oscillospiraceae bacterium]|nr:hypothetical protein [Oscillospiraceae bacterium]